MLLNSNYFNCYCLGILVLLLNIQDGADKNWCWKILTDFLSLGNEQVLSAGTIQNQVFFTKRVKVKVRFLLFFVQQSQQVSFLLFFLRFLRLQRSCFHSFITRLTGNKINRFFILNSKDKFNFGNIYLEF